MLRVQLSKMLTHSFIFGKYDRLLSRAVPIVPYSENPLRLLHDSIVGDMKNVWSRLLLFNRRAMLHRIHPMR